jgi:hypothetical protein
MKKICLLIFCLLFVQDVWAQRKREPLSADQQKLKDELINDREYIEVSCDRRSTTPNPDRDTSYRLKAIQAFTEAGEKSKLKKTCVTVEGDPIYSYLTVEKGKAQFFIDSSQDDFGPKRVYAYQCSQLEIGIYFNDLKAGRMVFQKIENSEGKDRQIVLRCLADSKEFIF